MRSTATIGLLACLWAAISGGEPAGESSTDERAVHFAERMAELTTGAPEGFTVVAAEPFVVLGDEAPDIVRRRAADTIAWAVRLLRADFFDHDPADAIAIWLFKDQNSYESHCRSLFSVEPSTPYGFYLSGRAALVMNIATGGGTLVHEMTHPFIRANFAKCPAWLNEGLASLFEQCRQRDGHIVGLTNWRLAGLQRAIEAGRTISIEKLAGLSAREFYGPSSGLHYAQARYLCLYLQEHGLLVKFWRQALRDHESAPTLAAVLCEVLNESNLTAFEKRWEEWVMSLRFPR